MDTKGVLNEMVKIKKDNFDGIVAVLYIDDVSSPSRWKLPDEEITICDKGMKWLEILPADEHYLITAMMDCEGNILLWYIDMIAGQGLDGDGVPCIWTWWCVRTWQL